MWEIVCTVEQNVNGVVITSSPLPIPSAASATCKPAVQEFRARACGESTYAAKSFSNCAVRGPVVSQPERRVAATSCNSSSPIEGR